MHGGKFGKELFARLSKDPRLALDRVNDEQIHHAVLWCSEHRFWCDGYDLRLPRWYFKVENEILRAKLPKRVPLAEKEKHRLVRFGTKLGKALNELTTIVHPSTLRDWIREAVRQGKQKLAKKGRPPTKEEIRELILKLAGENDGVLVKPHRQIAGGASVAEIIGSNGQKAGCADSTAVQLRRGRRQSNREFTFGTGRCLVRACAHIGLCAEEQCFSCKSGEFPSAECAILALVTDDFILQSV